MKRNNNRKNRKFLDRNKGDYQGIVKLKKKEILRKQKQNVRKNFFFCWIFLEKKEIVGKVLQFGFEKRSYWLHSGWRQSLFFN